MVKFGPATSVSDDHAFTPSKSSNILLPSDAAGPVAATAAIATTGPVDSVAPAPATDKPTNPGADLADSNHATSDSSLSSNTKAFAASQIQKHGSTISPTPRRRGARGATNKPPASETSKVSPKNRANVRNKHGTSSQSSQAVSAAVVPGTSLAAAARAPGQSTTNPTAKKASNGDSDDTASVQDACPTASPPDDEDSKLPALSGAARGVLTPAVAPGIATAAGLAEEGRTVPSGRKRAPSAVAASGATNKNSRKRKNRSKKDVTPPSAPPGRRSSRLSPQEDPSSPATARQAKGPN